MPEMTVYRAEFSYYHYYKQNYRRKSVTEFLVVPDCVFYYFYIIQLPTLNNCFHINHKLIKWKKMEKELLNLS